MRSDHTLVLRNARLLDLRTGQAGLPHDLCILDGRIVRGSGRSRIIDVEERLVMPGLWDSHVHFSSWARTRRVGSVREAASAAECAKLAGELSAQHSTGGPYLAEGYQDPAWPDSPSRELLDAATGRRPVMLVSYDRHACWLNSAAFGLLNITPTPSGRLVEQPCFEAQRRMIDLIGTADELIDDAGRDAASMGLVGIIDMEMDATPDLTWAARYDNGFRWLKVRAACYPDTLDAVAARAASGHLVRELVKIGPLKIIADGSMTARTAHTTFAYPGETEHPHGLLNADLNTLIELMTKADVAGLACAVHAIGDAAVGTTLEAFARSGASGRIEHAQLVDQPSIERMARLGLGASVQPGQLLDDRDNADMLWAHHTADAFPFASLLSAGIPLYLGSDAPVVPLNPWAAIEAAVTRTRDGRSAWHPEQRLTVSQALQASTGGVSALVPGAPADLIVMDDNPFEVAPDWLAQLRPYLTMCSGDVTYQAS